MTIQKLYDFIYKDRREGKWGTQKKRFNMDMDADYHTAATILVAEEKQRRKTKQYGIGNIFETYMEHDKRAMEILNELKKKKEVHHDREPDGREFE